MILARGGARPGARRRAGIRPGRRPHRSRDAVVRRYFLTGLGGTIVAVMRSEAPEGWPFSTICAAFGDVSPFDVRDAVYEFWRAGRLIGDVAADDPIFRPAPAARGEVGRRG